MSTMTDDLAPRPLATPSTSSSLSGRAIGNEDQELSVQDHRISVTSGGRTVLDVSIAELRRIQFDIERGRPATLVIVPDRASHEPRVIAVPPEQFDAAGEALAYLGHELIRDTGPDR